MNGKRVFIVNNTQAHRRTRQIARKSLHAIPRNGATKGYTLAIAHILGFLWAPLDLLQASRTVRCEAKVKDRSTGERTGLKDGPK